MKEMQKCSLLLGKKPLGNRDDFVLIGGMKKHSSEIRLFALVTALAVGGCGPTQSGDTTLFRDNRTDGTVFFTAMYDNPEDKPTFDDVFRVRADQGYVADIDDTHYADARLQTGLHTLSIDRIDWSGYTVDQLKLDVYLAPGQTIYVEEHVHTDDKVTLQQVDAAQGRQNLVARKRTCNCSNMLGMDF
jgi:hypothetical protein